MKERPILFQGDMVRAILAGNKTQTRRAAYRVSKNAATAKFDRRFPADYGSGQYPNLPVGHAWTLSGWVNARPGDRLWVREAFMVNEAAHVTYRADTPGPHVFRYKPSIHMPRWASRITLEITGVRVERLQDITDADALAEGVDRTNTSIPGYARQRFEKLWESINGPDSWAANPWVWCVEFKRLESA